ncbi:MAG: MarR family transcriptional regulator [Cyclobacteriaceae bacterium]
MAVDENKVGRFTLALEKMLMKMQEVDNSCVELTKDISKRDFSIIVFVGKQEEVIMRDIAEYLNIPMSTCTGIVDKLVEKGHLARFHSDEDRRIIKVTLSKFGRASFQLLESSLFNMGTMMLGDLKQKEQEELIKLLEKVTINLDQHVPTTPVVA